MYNIAIFAHMNYAERLENIAMQVAQNNTALALRMILDAVYDTDDMNLYQQAIELVATSEHTDIKSLQFKAEFDRLLERLKACSIVNKDEGATYLTAQSVQKSYHSGNFRLGPIDVSVKARKMLGLVGENGNGKTTLLRLLAQDLTLDRGVVNYNIGVKTNDLYHLRSRVAYVPQRTPVWYGTLKDNLRFTLSSFNTKPEEVETRMLLMIGRLGLWKYQDLKWSQLSSGYKMRFELARLLLTSPSLLLLDEPLANLDIFSQQIILEDIRMMAQSATHPFTVILSSQQLYEVEKQADEVLFLKEGQLKGVVNKADNKQQEQSEVILELDCDNSQAEVMEVFIQFAPRVELNGGVYVLHLQTSDTPKVWSVIGQGQLNIRMVRDISHSTRRFFN